MALSQEEKHYKSVTLGCHSHEDLKANPGDRKQVRSGKGGRGRATEAKGHEETVQGDAGAHVMIPALAFPHTGVKTNPAVPLRLVDFIAWQSDLNTADWRKGGGDGGDDQSRAQHHLMNGCVHRRGKMLTAETLPEQPEAQPSVGT